MADLAEQYVDAMLSSDRAVLKEICTDDVEFVVPGTEATGVDAIVRYNDVFLKAFPDASHEIVSRLEAMGAIVLEIRYRGTNTGPMVTPQGELPATGRSADIPGCMILRTQGGKVASFHGYFDQMGFMQQLGVMG
jgi:predicted ester cyclase